MNIIKHSLKKSKKRHSKTSKKRHSKKSKNFRKKKNKSIKRKLIKGSGGSIEGLIGDLIKKCDEIKGYNDEDKIKAEFFGVITKYKSENKTPDGKFIKEDGEINWNFVFTDHGNTVNGTLLFLVCRYGYIPIAKELIKMGANINIPNYNGKRPLHIVCELILYAEEHFAQALANMISYIVIYEKYAKAEKVNVNSQDKQDNTPLHYLCTPGYKNYEIRAKMIKLLMLNRMKRVANAEIRNEYNQTPLQYACCTKTNSRIPQENCKADNEIIIKALVENGAVVDARDEYQFTPLHWACRYGHMEKAMALIDMGADIDARDMKKHTPLHWACIDGHVEVAAALMDRGADIHAKDEYKMTPLHLACKYSHIKVAAALMDRGADIDTRDMKKHTPLHWACIHGHVEVAAALMDRGADIDTEDVDQYTPLRLACMYGHVEVVTALIDRGANMKSLDLERKDKCSQYINKNFRRTDLLQRIFDNNDGNYDGIMELFKAVNENEQFEALYNIVLTNKVGLLEHIVENIEGGIVKILSYENSKKQNILFLASSIGRPDILEYIISETNKPTNVTQEAAASRGVSTAVANI